MLRARPDRCPYCGHDVSGVLRCARCREAVPDGAPDVSRAPPIRGVGGTLSAVVGGSAVLAGVAAVALVQPVLAIGVAVASPLALGLVRSASARVASYVRRRAQRGPPPRGDAMIEARQALLARPGEPVSVRGRVRIELPVVEGTDEAVRAGRAGRFVIETDAGEALVDDDGLVAEPSLLVRDGDLVEVTGPARLVHEDTSSSAGYRAPVAARIVFDGTAERPLVIRDGQSDHRVPKNA
jgi:hypothetical protein